MEPEKEAAQCYEQMNIVEKYETVIAYLYPIAQNIPRKHGKAMPRTPMSAICSTTWRLTMSSAVINTRKDLDAIAGTPQHDAFMAMLAGTLWRIVKNDAAQAWVAVEDNSIIERFGFARTDFPDAAPPELPAYSPPPSDVPTVVTMRQARLALLQAGMLGQVNAAVANADEATKITWEFSSEVHRDHPFVATLTAALGLSEAQLDNLFTLAASL